MVILMEFNVVTVADELLQRTSLIAQLSTTMAHRLIVFIKT